MGLLRTARGRAGAGVVSGVWGCSGLAKRHPSICVWAIIGIKQFTRYTEGVL